MRALGDGKALSGRFESVDSAEAVDEGNVDCLGLDVATCSEQSPRCLSSMDDRCYTNDDKCFQAFGIDQSACRSSPGCCYGVDLGCFSSGDDLQSTCGEPPAETAADVIEGQILMQVNHADSAAVSPRSRDGTRLLLCFF